MTDETKDTKKPDKPKKKKPKIIPERVPMAEQAADVRIHNFNEVPQGYTPEEAMAEAKRCIKCKKQPCISGCPVFIKIPEFIGLIAEGKFLESAQKMKEDNLLPAICGRVCPQEEQCEIKCLVGKKGTPLGIGRLERFIADWERETGNIQKPEVPPPNGKKVAVVGSGPAGLTVAGDLVRWGYDVTIFEAFHKPGGVLVYGIPEFRLPKTIVQAEVDFVTSLGVTLKLDHVVGKIFTIDDMLDGEFDAVFVATGAGAPMFMRIPGENLNGIYSANEYLTRSNLMKAYLFPEVDTPIIRGRNVAVIGGGNVAMDSARTALRLGADNVYNIYRRSRVEMPARDEEIERAEEEGVQFHILCNPVQYIGDEKGWVKAAECLKMELGEPDDSGRRRPVPIKGSEYQIEVDTVIVAIGNKPNPLIPDTTPDLEISRWGTIVADEADGKTSKKNVWAAGDIVTGAATVILAMGAARAAAKSIDNVIMGREDFFCEKPAPEETPTPEA